MTKQQLVERTRLIRKEYLKLTQTELAEAIGSSQALVSRMELDGSGTIDVLIDIINFYSNKGIRVDLLWAPNFNIEMLTDPIGQNTADEIGQIVNDVKMSLDKITSKVKSIS